VILLVGIVKKNAIMMIDFALVAERSRGLVPEQSIYEACLLRYRPIMMTTMAALLGGLPLALGTGAGSELRRPLGIAIVGGLLLSQFLTLEAFGEGPVRHAQGEPQEQPVYVMCLLGARSKSHWTRRPKASAGLRAKYCGLRRFSLRA
jgi:hypothetical protein